MTEDGRLETFREVPENQLKLWLSSSSPEITDSRCAEAFVDLIRDTRNGATATMWCLLHQAHIQQHVSQQQIDEIIEQLDTAMVQGIDTDMQERLFAPTRTQDDIDNAYCMLNKSLRSNRNKLDSEIQKVIDEKAASRHIPLNTRSKMRCSLL